MTRNDRPGGRSKRPTAERYSSAHAHPNLTMSHYPRGWHVKQRTLNPMAQAADKTKHPARQCGRGSSGCGHGRGGRGATPPVRPPLPRTADLRPVLARRARSQSVSSSLQRSSDSDAARRESLSAGGRRARGGSSTGSASPCSPSEEHSDLRVSSAPGTAVAPSAPRCGPRSSALFTSGRLTAEPSARPRRRLSAASGLELLTVDEGPASARR